MAKPRRVVSKRQATGHAVPRAIGFWTHRSVAELAADQNAKPLKHVKDLTAALWESSDDLEAFLADVYRARDAGVA